MSASKYVNHILLSVFPVGQNILRYIYLILLSVFPDGQNISIYWSYSTFSISRLTKYIKILKIFFFQYFPMDKQMCTLEIESFGYAIQKIRIEKLKIKIKKLKKGTPCPTSSSVGRMDPSLCRQVKLSIFRFNSWFSQILHQVHLGNSIRCRHFKGDFSNMLNHTHFVISDLVYCLVPFGAI